jgi:hypothetical protein
MNPVVGLDVAKVKARYKLSWIRKNLIKKALKLNTLLKVWKNCIPFSQMLREYLG